MSDFCFKIKKSFSSFEEFIDASAEELRVLLVLIEKSGKAELSDLAALAGVSQARCKSCIALWESMGVIERAKDTLGEPVIIEEFEERLSENELYEVSGKELAQSIRDNKLADLFYEIAALLGKHELTPMEGSGVRRLSVQYDLSSEYIVSLAGYGADREKLSVDRLVRRGMKLAGEGVETVQELEQYIADKGRENAEINAYHRLLGIEGRKFSPSEAEYLRKWIYDYGFGEQIIEKAYDLSALNTGKVKFQYMDTLLEDWHLTGCKTIPECVARSEIVLAKLKAQMNEKNPKKSMAKAPKKNLRYGDFDPEEALKRALNRSFSKGLTPESEEK